MSIQPTATPGASAAPWREKNLSYGLKLLIMFGFVLSLIFGISSLFIVLGVAGSMVRGTVRSTGSVLGDLLPLLIANETLTILVGDTIRGLNQSHRCGPSSLCTRRRYTSTRSGRFDGWIWFNSRTDLAGQRG